MPVGWVDADRFETLAQAGRAQLARNEAADAAGTLRGALGMWRGPAFADVHDEPFAQASIGRLDELRIAAIADRVDADLALGATPRSSVSWRRWSASIRCASGYVLS